jgi:carbonic anhydrase/acetyltransferase-like protein (isoleucine patch superfamily)
MLHDGEINDRQHIGIHSYSLHMNVKEDSAVGVKANIDTFVITEDYLAQTAQWAVYGIVQFECLLPAVPHKCSICTSTVHNFRFFP